MKQEHLPKPGTKTNGYAAAEADAGQEIPPPNQAGCKNGGGGEPPQPAILRHSFEGQGVRSLEIDGQIWFVAADVCRALKLKPHKGSFAAHLDKLDADEKRRIRRDAVVKATPELNMGVLTEGLRRINAQLVHADDALAFDQDPLCWLISESGLYTVVLRSRDATTAGTLPYRFRRWVTADVLPSIRKTGRYEHPMAASEPAPGAFSRPGRYVTLVVGDGRSQTYHSPFAMLVDDAAEIDVRTLAYSIKLIEGLWDKVQILQAAGIDTTAGFAWTRLAEAIRSSSETASHFLACFEDRLRRDANPN
jgi:prophage antirepressor-like protein